MCCVLCMFPQFSKDKCKPVTEICRTPPNARYLGIEMFNSVYNHPPTPPFKYHNMTLGHICQKRKAFPRKNALIGHRSISLQSVCAKIMSSRTIAVERHSLQKLHLYAIALLQIFDFFSLVAGLLPVFVTSRTYCIY